MERETIKNEARKNVIFQNAKFQKSGKILKNGPKNMNKMKNEQKIGQKKNMRSTR